MNTIRTGLLLAALTGLFMAVGYLLGREQGMVIAFVFASGMNFFAYWNADKMVLRMHGAREVDPRPGAGILRPHRRACRHAGLPMPQASISWTIRSPTPSPPAAIPQNAAVAATTGLSPHVEPRRDCRRHGP